MDNNIVMMPIKDVHPYEGNPRINDDAVDAVAASIREFGFRNPIIVDKDRVIIAGHTRYKAAKKLRMKEVPVMIADDLSEEQVRAYRLADNKTAELAEWDFDMLDSELADIVDLDMSQFGFEGVDFSNLSGMMGEKDEEYLAFEEKFKPKYTTDDCFTPESIYNAVKEWVLEKYGNCWTKIVRPFYPGGDYQAFKYPEGCLVLDNPPFSIMAEILDFYNREGIDYFLFANSLTLFSPLKSRPRTNAIVVGSEIIYENGATVSTSFYTNLGEWRVELAASLYKIIEDMQKSDANEQNKYEFPDNVSSSAKLMRDVYMGINFGIKSDECKFIFKIEANPIGIFGGGILISDILAERLKAEREKVYPPKIILTLSPEEKTMVEELNKASLSHEREDQSIGGREHD